jgi:hypothetical protein
MPADKPIVPDTTLPDDPIEKAIRDSVAQINDGADDVDAGDEPVAEPETPPAEAEPVVEPAAEPVVETPPPAEAVTPDPAAAAAAPGAKAPADATKPVKTEDQFAKDHGLQAKDKSGRENKIPYSAVKDRIVPNAVKKARTEWEAKELTPAKKVIETYETRLQGIAGTENLMFGLDPETQQPLEGEAGVAAKRQFLQQLAISVPGYKELLAGANLGLSNTKTGAKAPSTTENAVDPNNDPEPKPDVVENGVAVGWSQEGLAKLRAWDRRQAARDAAEQTIARLDKEYGLSKMSGAFRTVQTRQQTLTQTDQVIEQAASWPGFKENADAILGELVKLPATLQGVDAMRTAYNSVMWSLANKPQVDRASLEAELRQKFAEELQSAPRSTSTSAGAVSTRAAQDVEVTGDPVEDAIRRSIRGLK